MAGLFFCLASANGAGLLFCPAAMQPIQAFTARFVPFMQLYSSHRKTAHVALQALFLRFSLFHRPRYQTDTSGYNTTCDTLEHITATQHLQRIPDTIATPRRCIAQHSRPIIIMYIRVQPCYRSMPDGATHRRPCQPGGVSMLPTPGISMAPGWSGISLALCFLPGTAARNHWRLPPYLFSGFRPIANKGEQ